MYDIRHGSGIADLAGTSWETAVRVLSPLERGGRLWTDHGEGLGTAFRFTVPAG